MAVPNTTARSQPVELMKTHVIHAMTISYPYLAAVSGDKVGIWNLNQLPLFSSSFSFHDTEEEITKTPAVWSTTVLGCQQQRITSITISKDGMGFFFRCCLNG
eukprot:8022215-Ditylum_brightwellii.AAC.1